MSHPEITDNGNEAFESWWSYLSGMYPESSKADMCTAWRASFVWRDSLAPVGAEWPVAMNSALRELESILATSGEEFTILKVNAAIGHISNATPIAASPVARETLEEKRTGHIAPAYAALLPGLQDAARKMGYALAIHGSLARDLDLIAVPWVDWAVDPEKLVSELARLMGGQIQTVEEKQHGRHAWTVTLEGAGFIDISVTPRPATPSQEERKDA